jgi:sugar phosphate isomerase/epimerase
MKIERIALQCYTIRDHTKTAEDFAASMKRARSIGYQAVQISGIGPIPAAEVRRICDGEGLTICATHEPGKTIVEEPAAVVERLGELGCRHTAYPYPHVRLETEADVARLSDELERAGDVLHGAGMTLSYHNHQIEFRHIGGRTILDRLYASTPASVLKAEIDTYWVQVGGGNPADWCARLAGRLPLLHMKDYAIGPDNAVKMAAVGEGNLDWHAIVHAAESSGCEWFIVEQDNGFTDAFEAIASSLKYIQNNLVE